MHAVFAIEPDAVNSWKELRYIVEKFGFSKGALIVSYPSEWMKLVIEACKSNGASDLDLTRITEKLRQAKEDRIIKLGLPYDRRRWREAVSTEKVIENIDAVLVDGRVSVGKFYDVGEDIEYLFENRREFQVERRAEALASAARCVLMNASELTLVDPYFIANRMCAKVLIAMINLALNLGGRLKRIAIYTSFNSQQVDRDTVRDLYVKLLGSVAGVGVDLVVYRLEPGKLDVDLHARYLLTPKAGMRYDRGFVEPAAEEVRRQKTDVVCMDKAAVDARLELYSEEAMAHCLVDVIKLSL